MCSHVKTSGHLHFIEVKGRIDGGDTITVTTNEMLVSLNAGERFVLAIVPVGENGFSRQSGRPVALQLGAHSDHDRPAGTAV